MNPLRQSWTRLTDIVETIVVGTCVLALPAAIITWLTILPSIGVLWILGGLK